MEVTRQNLAEVQQVLDQSPVRCYDPESARRMMARIDQAREEGESLGGVFETGALGVPLDWEVIPPGICVWIAAWQL